MRLKEENLPLPMPSKKSHIKLYADECFPVPSATFLKASGYSVIHAYDKNLVQKNDRIHLSEAKKLGRILITLDRDFLYYNEINLSNYPGVIVISVGSAIPINVDKVCKKLLKNISEDFTKDSLIKVTINKVIKIKGGRTILEKDY